MRSRNARLWVAVLSCIGLGAGCARSNRPDTAEPVRSVSTRTQALTAANGLGTNSLTTNSLWQNGFWANGFWANSLAENGFWANGFWANGFWANGFWANGFWANGFWANGFWANGFWANGFWANGIAADTLKQNQYTRQLLQYIYECAMPKATATQSYDTFLDPNDGSLACNLDGTCDAGYECQDAKCVVPLRGSVGVGINTNEDLDEDGDVDEADQLGWWESGECHESCQRWISACVLARTNAYGVRVEISMGAAADAPRRIREALGAPGDDPYPERRAASGGEYVLREGAFYGNLFATTPGQLAADGSFEPMPPPTPPTEDRVSSEVFQMAPTFSACAGPASNIPDMTKRFCSSQGDQTVIDVPGVCVSTGTQTGVCEGVDAVGSIHDCVDADDVPYEEVITVYLKQPLATPGNGICEDHVVSIDGVVIPGTENELNSGGDCLHGTWAIDYGPEFGFGVTDLATDEPERRWLERAMSAVAPDDSIVVIGKTAENVNLGDAERVESDGLGLLAKYNPEGKLLWWRRVESSPAPSDVPDSTPDCDFSPNPCGGGGIFFDVHGVTVAPNGNIVVAGYSLHQTSGGLGYGLWVNLYGPDGDPIDASTPITADQRGFSALELQGFLASTRLIAADSDGAVVLAGLHFSDLMAGPIPLDVDRVVGDDGPDDELEGGKYFIVKIDPDITDPAEKVRWAVTLPGAATNLSESSGWNNYPLSLAIDGHDDILLVTEDRQLEGIQPGDPVLPGDRRSGGYVRKFSGDAGSHVWSIGEGTPWPVPTPVYTVVAADAHDDVYASGFVESGAHFGGTTVSVKGRVPFLAKYTRDGHFDWVEVANTVCPSRDPDCTPVGEERKVQGMTISFDTDGNVVLGSYGNPVVGGGIDFSPGTSDYFRTYSYNNFFVSAYDPILPSGQRLLWARQIPTILGSSLLGVALTSENRVIVSGNYSGSMQSAGQVLVSDLPEDPAVAHAFLSSFGAPSLADTEGPSLGVVDESPDAPLLTVPADMVVQATGPDGAVVFFMPPTAIDHEHSGVNVTCTPEPNAVFPFGQTQVTCTAADTRGNIDPERSVASFRIFVVDSIGPIFTGVRAVRAEATGTYGAVVTYALPGATDQVDGTRPVVCAPSPGSTFGFGTTEVTCTSSDTRGNASIVTFPVRVPYLWSGFLPPIEGDGSSVHKLGSSVPVKFKLLGFSKDIENLFAKLTLRKLSPLGPWIDATSTSAGTIGNLFRYDTKDKQYIFNLSTKGLSKGRWELSVDMGDGESRTVTITLR